MAILGLFGGGETRAQAQRLHETVVQVSRQPVFFGPGKVADTLQGRLEVVSLHAALALLRLQSEPQPAGRSGANGAGALGQLFTDILFRSLDAGLREAGVGDLTVPKKMRGIAQRFYGRLNAYGAALREPEDAALAKAIGRILWGEEAHPCAAGFARYMRDLHSALASRSLAELDRLDGWSAAAPPDC